MIDDVIETFVIFVNDEKIIIIFTYYKYECDANHVEK